MDKNMLKHLTDAMFHYENLGYQYINIPWTVSEEISNLTKPPERKNFYVNDCVLVGSGEQSFMQLDILNKLEPGKYYGISPCWRSEDKIDKLHVQEFMKVELYQNFDTSDLALSQMITHAQWFFNEYLETFKNITQDGFDIVTSNGIELGSYGRRKFDNGLNFLYGTGVAEPRLSIALEEENK